MRLEPFAALLSLAPLSAPSRVSPLPPAAARVPSVVNVEIDYMVDVTHSHQPPQVVLDALVQMYACHGIVLNLELDDAIPHTQVIGCNDPSNDPFWECTHPDSITTLQQLYGDHQGELGWHYCIIGHDYDSGSGTGSSGRSNGSSIFMVTLGSFRTGPVGTDFQVAATFAHELGHDLGLGHASENTANVSGPYAPNYASLMSYRYQLAGVKSGMECLGLLAGPHVIKDLDYSNGRLPLLDEQALSETLGVGIHEVDWDCDTLLTPGLVMRDLDVSTNPLGSTPFCSAPLGGDSVLDDYDDWSNLSDVTFLPEVARGEVVRSDYECLTARDHAAWEEAHARAHEGLNDPSGCPAGRVTLAVEPCTSGRMVFVDPSFVGSQQGTGENPFTGLAIAAATAPDGSVIYLQPGTSTNSGFPIVLDRPLILAGPGGGAVVDP